MKTPLHRRIQIISTGQYLPKGKISSEELDRRLGFESGSCLRSSGVQTRYFTDGVKETSSKMGAMAAQAALDAAGLKFSDLSALVCASGTGQQEVPYTAALIQKEMGQLKSGIPCFDVNSTCLSFVTGLDVVSYMVEAGRYERVLLVSTERATAALNLKDISTASLFGDGACAVLIAKTPNGETSRILSSGMETYAEGAEHSQLLGGGSLIHPDDYSKPEYAGAFYFQMDGRKAIRVALDRLPKFVERILGEAGLKFSDIDLFVPHQASHTGMELLRRAMGISDENWMNILPDYGNMISVSIPLALRQGILQGRIKRGTKVMLLGTSAGFSVGGMVLEY